MTTGKILQNYYDGHNFIKTVSTYDNKQEFTSQIFDYSRKKKYEQNEYKDNEGEEEEEEEEEKEEENDEVNKVSYSCFNEEITKIINEKSKRYQLVCSFYKKKNEKKSPKK